ncbi:hypothetical protein DFAR_670015 [Desulfarculales bacterium]
MIRVASLFSQLLHYCPHTEFAVLVKEHGAAVKIKGFPVGSSSWPCSSVTWPGPTPEGRSARVFPAA